ncbi:MAG: hypothetical protein A2122_02590 [Candidatus Liptonbacteria bacterium GWB1_49_6]|uniref:Uncharacterized protein n=1 Tax=Candidatus Liptonbacteria bacterium GWB1_49_6 TaxID=1798644 RepID=A0A1G2C713_9BACT|nr:MAG: hypothetical protein A2122_02590 [Candidatus Liptonbacteria bacterium GWB1_49_6]
MTRRGKIILAVFFGVMVLAFFSSLFQIEHNERAAFLTDMWTTFVVRGLVPAFIITVFIVVPMIFLILRWESKHPRPRCPTCGQVILRETPTGSVVEHKVL